MELRELLSSYEYPGDDIPIIKGSAHQAMIGERKDIGEDSIRALMAAVDSYIPTPARAVARELGLLREGRVVTGAELEALSAAEFADLLQPVTLDPAFSARLERSFDGNGQLADSAWPVLADARRKMEQTRARILRTLDDLLRSESFGALLQDRFVTERDGRP